MDSLSIEFSIKFGWNCSTQQYYVMDCYEILAKTVLNKNKLKRSRQQNQERFVIEIREQTKCTLLHYLYAGQIYAPFQQMNSLLLWYCQNRLSAMSPKKSDKVLRISKFEVFVCTTWLNIDNRTLTEAFGPKVWSTMNHWPWLPATYRMYTI